MSTKSERENKNRRSVFEDPFFGSSWQEFEKLREEMTTESQNLRREFPEKDYHRTSSSSMSTMMSSSSSLERRPKPEKVSFKMPDECVAPSSSSQAATTTTTTTTTTSPRYRYFKSPEPAKTTFSSERRKAYEIPKPRIEEKIAESTSGSEQQRRTESNNIGTSSSADLRAKFFNDMFIDKDEFDESIDTVTLKNDSEVFEVTLDIQGYQPNELVVTIGDNRVLTVEGRHEDEYINKNFKRKYTLPPSVHVRDVQSSLLMSEGKLIITAPKKALSIRGQVIPITVHK